LAESCEIIHLLAMPPELHRLTELISTLRLRYKFLNPNYEAGWTHRRCMHKHPTLIEAAKCAMPHGAGWYVFAVQGDMPRELTDAEDKVVNEFRFGAKVI
jgi:hypothetical protein